MPPLPERTVSIFSLHKQKHRLDMPSGARNEYFRISEAGYSALSHFGRDFIKCCSGV